MEENLRNRFIEINEGLEAFANEMKIVGLWKNVTLIQTSDFARTLTPNSGIGTDHAWAGNYIMMGKFIENYSIFTYSIWHLLVHEVYVLLTGVHCFSLLKSERWICERRTNSWGRFHEKFIISTFSIR